MAGVYISGMKLPDLKDGGITIFVYPDKKKGGNYIRWMDNNTSDIYAVRGKAISVPDHGRLVDGDKEKVRERETTKWIRYWIEERHGDWGKSGPTICAECNGDVEPAYRFCPWCGRKTEGTETITIYKDGDMYGN